MICSYQSYVYFVLFLVLIIEGYHGDNEFDKGMKTRERRSTRKICQNDKECKSPEFKSHPKNITYHKKKRLKCKAVGNPSPTITWKRLSTHTAMADTVIDTKNKDYEVSIDTRPTSYKGFQEMVVSTMNIITWDGAGSSAVYVCIATNTEGTVQSSKAYVTKIQTDMPNLSNRGIVPGDKNYKSGKERCVKLRNDSACWGYLDPRRTIWSEGDVEFLEPLLSDIKRKLPGNSEISDNCKPMVIPFLCYRNFPYCSENNMPKEPPQRICQHNCKILSTTTCKMEFQSAKRDEAMKSIVPQNCNNLPKTNCTSTYNEMKKVRDYLLSLPTKNDKDNEKDTLKIGTKVDPNDFCYFKKGEEYLGVVNRTENKTPCLKWRNSNHAFCRNPEALLRDRPWCYTSNSGDYGYCSIPPCAIHDSQTSNILYTIIPCLLFALGLSLAIITLAWRRHKQHFYQSTPGSPKQLVPRVNPKIQELNREDLYDFQLIGEGNLGRIYTADYMGNKDGRTFTACVAVKAIIERATNQQIQDFVREAETRSNFKHENVIGLIGVISREEPLSLIYEYTGLGDLHEYLLRHSPNYSDAHASDNCGPLDFHDLFLIGKQIANGMSYLSTHAFVHKDLAARNCLVTDTGIVKISDFSGLCDMYAGDYYRAPGRPPLPVRWMAPEAITDLNFTTSSDVWSFAVVLWEIFSYGSRPFFGLSNYKAMEHILDHDLLPCPEICPKPIYHIMTECWKVEANVRPAFPEIYNKLKAMNDLSSYMPARMQQYSPDSGRAHSPLHPSVPDMPMHPSDIQQMQSVHSMSTMTPSSMRHCQREIPLGSYKSSHHSRHSSSHSVNSVGHHPASISSQPRSVPSAMMNGVQRPYRTALHSVPSDGYHSLSRSEHHSTHNAYIMDNQFPMHNMDHRSLSSASSHHRMHPMGGYSNYPPSYPPSLAGPPASSVFSRQSSSHPSSKTSESIKSYESANQRIPLHHPHNDVDKQVYL